jgi:hypothetical protein
MPWVHFVGMWNLGGSLKPGKNSNKNQQTKYYCLLYFLYLTQNSVYFSNIKYPLCGILYLFLS